MCSVEDMRVYGGKHEELEDELEDDENTQDSQVDEEASNLVPFAVRLVIFAAQSSCRERSHSAVLRSNLSVAPILLLNGQPHHKGNASLLCCPGTLCGDRAATWEDGTILGWYFQAYSRSVLD